MTPEYRERVRERLERRIRYLNAPNPFTLEGRIEEAAACRHEALLREAWDLNLEAVPDPGHPGRFVTRVQRVIPTGRCNLTTATSCTCPTFRIWERCPCQALVIHLVGSISRRHAAAERNAA